MDKHPGSDDTVTRLYVIKCNANKESSPAVMARRFETVVRNQPANSSLVDEMLALAEMLEKEAKLSGSNASTQNLAYAAGYIRAHF